MDSDLPPQPGTPEERPHKPADDREELYYQGRPLLRGDVGKLVGFTLAGLIMIALPIVLWSYEYNPPIWLWLVSWIIGIALMFVPLILTLTIRYRISNYRIDYERGILSKTIDPLELWHVEDVSLHQSLLDRILRVGSIVVISRDDTSPRLELRSLPNPRPLFETLKQRIIAVKRQRGVIKMDVG
jgi:hypothetical protein